VLVSEGRNIVLVTAGGGTHVLVHDLPDIATSIAEDASGNLWLGTMTRGILTARPSLEAATTAAPPFNSPGLSAIDGWGLVRANADGAILAFARNAGWIKGPAATSFEAIGGYPRRDVAAASAIDGSGDAWIVHSASDGIPVCVARIAIHGDHATWQAHSLEGLWEIGLPRCVLAEPAPAGGTILWIGGTDGIVRNVVRSGPVAPTPQTPLLHAFARGAEHEALQPISGPLPYQTRSVVFEFAAPEYSRRPALRLQTRMDGIDEGWVAAGPKARREFTAMRDGRYDFRVRAVAETGLISGEAAFHFEIAPPWWRTFPAILGAAVLLGAATFGVYRLRVRALRRHNADLEEKVRERTEQLARASAAKTQFVANMSHDIRNPLNGIVGLALALEDTRLDGCQREIVATLRECTTYLSSLVDDVLDFASIESGRVTLRPGPFVPAELLRSVVATLRADAAQRSAVLTVDAAPGLPAMLLGDAGRIQQILVNYVTNALKYAGGEIRLSASVPPGSPGEIEFAVSDRGPGIDGAAQSILFTKFTRLPHGRESGIKGTGLGLASCRLLADVMNGSVGVESHPGHGARFFLRLPLTVGAAPPAAVNSPFAEASVLVVEDTDYNAWAAAAVLSRLGLAHVRARTGAEALSLFAERRFNVVLLDRNLPDMDGTAVARRMRGLEPDGPRAILLAVTAYCTPEDRTCCLDAGMDAFVGKPLTPEKLRKILIAAGRQLLTAASVQASADTRAPAAVDLSLLGYLSDGTEHGLDAQVDRFVTALVEADDRLAHAAAAREFGVLADAAHLVLSQAKLIGGAALEAAALALERSARDHQASAFAERHARVHTEIAALTEALHHRHRATHSV
jgi:signal transduction histidine kinase/DNA-binding response OmpR family regulator